MRLKLLIPTTTLILLATVLATATSGLLSPQQAGPTDGTITHSAGIGIYNESEATTTCTNINWGELNPKSSIAKTIYVKNTGNATEILNLETADWNPTIAASVLTLSWDKENSSLIADQVVAATLTLTMGEDLETVDNFEFNIIIKGYA